MNIDGILTRGRERAESLMRDSGVMRRPTGHTAIDPDTDQETEVLTVLFRSKCKVQTGGLQALDAEAGARTTVTVRLELHLPVSAPPVQTGDIWEVTTVGALSDVTLLGRKFRVTAPALKSFATARRLQVEEIVA